MGAPSTRWHLRTDRGPVHGPVRSPLHSPVRGPGLVHAPGLVHRTVHETDTVMDPMQVMTMEQVLSTLHPVANSGASAYTRPRSGRGGRAFSLFMETYWANTSCSNPPPSGSTAITRGKSYPCPSDSDAPTRTLPQS